MAELGEKSIHYISLLNEQNLFFMPSYFVSRIQAWNRSASLCYLRHKIFLLFVFQFKEHIQHLKQKILILGRQPPYRIDQIFKPLVFRQGFQKHIPFAMTQPGFIDIKWRTHQLDKPFIDGNAPGFNSGNVTAWQGGNCREFGLWQPQSGTDPPNLLFIVGIATVPILCSLANYRLNGKNSKKIKRFSCILNI